MENHLSPLRESEETIDIDAAEFNDASVVFIGQIRSPWTDRAQCPRNISGAREAGQGARVEVEAPFWRGLTGLRVGQSLMLIYWMDRARRDLILQAPRHADGPRGTFALRSPNRPNPIAMSAVTIRALDIEAGVIEIDAIDCLDGTPLVDLKPWLPSIDMPAGAKLDEGEPKG